MINPLINRYFLQPNLLQSAYYSRTNNYKQTSHKQTFLLISPDEQLFIKILSCPMRTIATTHCTTLQTQK